MKPKEIARPFLRFLKDCGLYAIFLKEFDANFMGNCNSIIEYLNNYCRMDEYVVNAFDWESSKLRFDFWNYVSERWEEICSIIDEYGCDFHKHSTYNKYVNIIKIEAKR